jgi:hypothetical protein
VDCFSLRPFLRLQKLNRNLQLVSIYDLDMDDERDWDSAVKKMHEDYTIENFGLTWLTDSEGIRDSKMYRVLVAPVGESQSFRLTAFNTSG